MIKTKFIPSGKRVALCPVREGALFRVKFVGDTRIYGGDDTREYRCLGANSVQLHAPSSVMIKDAVTWSNQPFEVCPKWFAARGLVFQQQ